MVLHYDARQHHEKKGSAILLTLVITMIILTSVIVLGTLVISSIRRSQLQSSAFSAYYAAESIIERALYDLRKEKKQVSGGGSIEADLDSSTCMDAYNIDDISSDFSCAGGIEYETQAYFSSIKKNQSVQVSIVDPEGVDIGAGVNEVRVDCKDANSGGNTLWIEVTAFAIASGIDWLPDASKTEKVLGACPSAGNTITVTGFDTASSYVIKVSALYDDAKDIYVKAYGSGGAQQDIGGYFDITATVNYSAFTSQEIRVQIPSVSTVSSLFDYVVYSEATITKDVAPSGSP